MTEKNVPYKGTLLGEVSAELHESDIANFNYLSLHEINSAITQIDTNKSYERHSHWKSLHTSNHAAKQCLLHIFRFWTHNVFTSNNPYHNWDLFAANLNTIPKKGKIDLSTKKSWRPITIGSSENWILEKVMLSRLSPYLVTKDCQFGYKSQHSTNHAIEIVRTLERSHDAHVCLLDASSAFDKLSWRRIKDQLVKRNVPSTLVKLTMTQLFSTKISVCNTAIFYPRTGVKQGGVLSGIIFASCYDDLVESLETTGAGILLSCVNNRYKLICVIIYADDVLVMATRPHGLKCLINKVFLFANQYSDITFNAGKSCILRLGPHRKQPVSVCGIPTSESYTYLGVEIGRAADPQSTAAAKLYKNTNVLFSQNADLKKCSIEVKNMCIYSYGNVYAIENLLCVNSRLRQAHRYMTKLVHCNWRQFADLDGPNIRSRRLYSVFQLDSLEVIHRKRRNNFLLKAAAHTNSIISGVIGNLDRITG